AAGLPGDRAERPAGDRHKLGQDVGDGDVHHSQRHTLLVRAHLRADTRRGCRTLSRARPLEVGVPAHREPAAAGSGLLYGDIERDPDPRTHTAARRHATRSKPGSLRHHHGDEPRDRDDHTPPRPKPLRGERDLRHVGPAGGEGGAPERAGAALRPLRRDLRPGPGPGLYRRLRRCSV
ncbi:MAG: TRAP-type C4-dicarboxylate transport system, large permease component, partial [uncultured Rubrobacteraceae bacterium]